MVGRHPSKPIFQSFEFQNVLNIKKKSTLTQSSILFFLNMVNYRKQTNCCYCKIVAVKYNFYDESLRTIWKYPNYEYLKSKWYLVCSLSGLLRQRQSCYLVVYLLVDVLLVDEFSSFQSLPQTVKISLPWWSLFWPQLRL